MKIKNIRLLLIEDDPGDSRLVREALSETGTVRFDLVRAADLAEGLAILAAQPADAILLDLNLPGVDGRHVLTAIKTDPDLHTIPVIILTTSSATSDIELAYREHANCYLVKPLGFTALADTIEVISAFWLDTVTLPPTWEDSR